MAEGCWSVSNCWVGEWVLRGMGEGEDNRDVSPKQCDCLLWKAGVSIATVKTVGCPGTCAVSRVRDRGTRGPEGVVWSRGLSRDRTRNDHGGGRDPQRVNTIDRVHVSSRGQLVLIEGDALNGLFQDLIKRRYISPS